MSIKDPKPQDDEFVAFLRGKDELSLLLREIPQPSPSEQLDTAILADAERAAARSRMPPPAAANDAILPASERIRRPPFATRWGIALGLVAGAAVTFLLLALQSASRIPRPPEGRQQRPLELRMYPSEAEDLQPQDDPAELPMPALKAPHPAPAPPAIKENPASAQGKISPQPADKTGSQRK